MKVYCLTLILILKCSLFIQAQDSFENWQKQKQDAYARWKQQNGIQGSLPVSAQQQSVSNFINEGFSSAGQPTGEPVSSPPATVSSPQVSAVQPAAEQPEAIKVWAVIVGVASYNHIQSLSYTDDDAYKVYAFFKSPEGGALPDGQVKVLIDEEATRKNIVDALKETYSNAGEKDVILFFFSGHGSDGAFITHEFDGTLEDENGNYKGFLLHSELKSVFDQSPARYKYIIADACHSGSSANKGFKSPATSATDNYYQAFDGSKGGLVMMLSSMGDEVSIETGGLRQGIFSYNLIQGLKGKADANSNKIISVTELFDYVETNVKEFTNNKQNPVIDGDYDVNMPIAVVR